MTESNLSLKSIVSNANAKNVNSTNRSLRLEINSEEPEEYQAFTFGRVGYRPQLMIEFVKADGYSLVLPYIDLRAIRSVNKSCGFVLEFTRLKITIEGRNLECCYRYLKQTRLEQVIEATRESYLSVERTEPIVISIADLAK